MNNGTRKTFGKSKMNELRKWLFKIAVSLWKWLVESGSCSGKNEGNGQNKTVLKLEDEHSIFQYK